MARISTYPTDSTLTSVDKLIGTNDVGDTIQVSASTVVQFVNESGKLEGNVSSRFTYIPYIGGARQTATIALPTSSADELDFDGITQFVLSRYTVNGNDFANYWNAINGGRIMIQKASDISKFALFDVTDVSENETQSNFYDITVTHVTSADGLEKGQDYFVFLLQYDADDVQDKNYVHTQSSVSTTWSITHNLGKKPSVTIVDSGDTTVIGDVTYNDNNSLTVTFSSAFSGKAYLN